LLSSTAAAASQPTKHTGCSASMTQFQSHRQQQKMITIIVFFQILKVPFCQFSAVDQAGY